MTAVQKCPICGEDSLVIARVPDINPSGRHPVALRACKSCGHWFHIFYSDQKELNSLYESASPFVVGSDFRVRHTDREVENGFYRYMNEWWHVKGSRQSKYLEIGTGDGNLLKKFQNAGCRCYGADPGRFSRDSNIYRTVDEIPEDLKFDIFVLKDVLEHLIDPVQMMKKIRVKADAGAALFCSFPCKDSRPARIGGQRWPMLRPYGHLHYFSLVSAVKMFELSGWTIDRMQLAGTHSWLGMARKLDIKQMLYTLVKGGRDQLYIMGSPSPTADTEIIRK